MTFRLHQPRRFIKSSTVKITLGRHGVGKARLYVTIGSGVFEDWPGGRERKIDPFKARFSLFVGEGEDSRTIRIMQTAEGLFHLRRLPGGESGMLQVGHVPELPDIRYPSTKCDFRRVDDFTLDVALPQEVFAARLKKTERAR